MCACLRRTQRESEKSYPGGIAMLQPPLLHSPLWTFDMHAQAPCVISKPLGLELKLWSAIWESSSLTTPPPAGLKKLILYV